MPGTTPELYIIFVDLTKVFDTVSSLSREGLWKIMAKYGCPQLTFITRLVRQFYDGMVAHVLDDSQTSNQFPVGNGVKQGCTLAPALFSLMFSAMLTDVFIEDDPGLDVQYRTDRMHAI
jgi:hypothetical protein